MLNLTYNDVKMMMLMICKIKDIYEDVNEARQVFIVLFISPKVLLLDSLYKYVLITIFIFHNIQNDCKINFQTSFLLCKQ